MGDILSPTAGVKVVVMSQKVVCYPTLSTLIGLIVSWAAGNVDKEAGERRRRGGAVGGRALSGPADNGVRVSRAPFLLLDYQSSFG